MVNSMSALRVRPVDVGGSIGKGLQIKNAMAEMKDRDRARAANTAFAEAFSAGVPTDPAGRQALVSKAAQVSPQAAFDTAAYFRDMDTTARTKAVEEAGIIHNALKDVTDPQGYAVARQSLMNIGIDDVPETYNPKLTAQVLQAAKAIMPRDPNLLSAEAAKQKVDIANQSRTPSLTFDQKMKLAQAGKSSTNVNMPPAEKEEQKALGKYLVKSYEGIQEAATAAEDTLAQLAIARSIPVETGADAPMRAAIGAYAQALSIDPQSVGLDQVSGAQALTGVMNNLVLTKMQAQKGPQTENDAARIEATLARLGNTPAANDFLFRSAEALAVRDIERAQFYRAHRQETGSFDGAESAWDKHKAQTPLVGTHPETRQPVFYYEFENLVKRANPGASRDQILKLWRSKYDG